MRNTFMTCLFAFGALFLAHFSLSALPPIPPSDDKLNPPRKKVIFQDKFNRSNNPSLSNRSFNYGEDPDDKVSLQNNRAVVQGDFFIKSGTLSGSGFTHALDLGDPSTVTPKTLTTTIRLTGTSNNLNPTVRIGFVGLTGGATVETSLQYDKALQKLQLSVKEFSIVPPAPGQAPNITQSFETEVTLPGRIDLSQDHIFTLETKGPTITGRLYPKGTQAPIQPNITLEGLTTQFATRFFVGCLGLPNDNILLEVDDVKVEFQDNKPPEITLTLPPFGQPGMTITMCDPDGTFGPNGLDFDTFKFVANGFDNTDFVNNDLPGVVIEDVGGKRIYTFPLIDFTANDSIVVSISDKNGAKASDAYFKP